MASLMMIGWPFFVVLYGLSLFSSLSSLFSFDELHNGAQNASVFFLSFTFPKSNKSAPELYIPHLGDHVGGHWSCDQF